MGVVGGFLNFRVGSVAEASLSQVDPFALSGLCGNPLGHRYVQWYEDAKTKVRYLRIRVSGKSRGSWLIAKYGAAVVFERLAKYSP
jgi:hypothetical protein